MYEMRRLPWALSLLAVVAGCGGGSMRNVAATTQGRRIAVVSLSINDYGGSLQGWNSTRTSDLMSSRAAAMVGMVEQQLSSSWQVVPAPAFVGHPGLQSMATAHDVAIPYFSGVVMPTVAVDRRALIRAELTPQQAQALAQLAGADLLVVIYAEWGVATGGMIPTSKALSKTVMSVYDASGQRLYHGRADRRGQRTLGAFGHVVVDENSIDEWVNAFGEAIARLLQT